VSEISIIVHNRIKKSSDVFTCIILHGFRYQRIITSNTIPPEFKTLQISFEAKEKDIGKPKFLPVKAKVNQ